MDAGSLRKAMKEKAKRLSGATSEKVDASTFTPAEPLNADVKTGARPISRRAFKVGGKVHGAEAMTHAGRTPRKSGGKTEYANALVNRNVKDANEEREGIKHVGGFKKGGRTAKQVGGDLTSSMRPMPRPTPEMMDEMGIARPTTMATSPRPKPRPMTRPEPRPSPERMREIMDEVQIRQGIDMLDRAAKYGDGQKNGGKIEGSAKDMKEDKKMAAKMGMTMKEWEASQADKMHDMPSKGRTKKMGGGSMDADDEPRKGPYQIVHQKTGKVVGKANTLNGARKSRERNDMEYGSYAHQIIDTATGKATMKDGGRAAKMSGGNMGYAAGGKMKMVEKDGKKVPFFAADGVGKMANGGGLYANIHAKRERIEDGSKEKMRKPGAKGAPSASDFKDAARTAKKNGGGMKSGGRAAYEMAMADSGYKVPFAEKKTFSHTGPLETPEKFEPRARPTETFYEKGPSSILDFPISGRDMPTEMREESDRYAGDITRRKSGGSAMKKGGKAMHHKDCMCKACGGAAMSQEGGRMARKSGGKVGKSNISINIFPHNAEKPGAGPMPPMGAPPMPPMPAPMMKPPMPMPAPAPMPSAPPPAHMSIPPGLQQAMAGAAGAGPMPPAGGGMPAPMMNRPPMPAPMMGRKAGGKVVYPITGGAGGGRARKEKVDAYGEKMNKDLRK